MGMACLYLRHQIPANTPLTRRCSWSCREPHRLAFSESTAHHSNFMLNTACEDFVAGQGKELGIGKRQVASVILALRPGASRQPESNLQERSWSRRRHEKRRLSGDPVLIRMLN